MQQPNPLAITLLCIGGAALLVFLFWLNHVLRTGGKRQERRLPQAPPLVSLGLSYLLGGTGPVNTSSDVMSRPQEAAPREAPSSLETDARQTPDRPTMAVPPQEKILDIFRVMRAAGMKRDAVSGAWRAAGLPFDNNLWTKAAPPEEEEAHVTPIAGRPTKASYYPDDPELAYRPPPS